MIITCDRSGVLGGDCFASIGTIKEDFDSKILVGVFIDSKHNKNKTQRLAYFITITFIYFFFCLF